jgi:glutamate---cysteine ligase / carboxylate-amine ligase
VTGWAAWAGGAPASGAYTLGAEEEVMLLRPGDWSLAQVFEDVLPSLSADLADHVMGETHGAALELRTRVHRTAAQATNELWGLRAQLERDLSGAGLAAACCGLHPFAVWQETVVRRSGRYGEVYRSMRELAHREPTFALHVHVGLADPDRAIVALNRIRAHLPLLLALSANSPFWQGRDTGLASARTSVFQAFPRTGLPRAFADYADYVRAVDMLIRARAIPDHTFLWWDARPQPALGTVEIRIMDVATEVEHTAALIALVHCLVRLEVEQGWASDALVGAPEVLAENRFLAARDGINAELIEPESGTRQPVRELADAAVAQCRGHAQDLDCIDELEAVAGLARNNGADRQREIADRESLAEVVRAAAQAFTKTPARRGMHRTR